MLKVNLQVKPKQFLDLFKVFMEDGVVQKTHFVRAGHRRRLLASPISWHRISGLH